MSEQQPGPTAGAQSDAREGACAPREISEQEKIDVAFRVIADHIRTLSFAIADGIQPGNTVRNYVLRRILRRAVKYGRTLGFHEPFFYKLVDVLARTMGDVFPEIRAKQQHVKDVLKLEEEAFNKTLDSGIEIVAKVVRLQRNLHDVRHATESILGKIQAARASGANLINEDLSSGFEDDISAIWKIGHVVNFQEKVQFFDMPEWEFAIYGKELFFGTKLLKDFDNIPMTPFSYGEGETTELVPDKEAKARVIQTVEKSFTKLMDKTAALKNRERMFPGRAAFVLYDTYGFPLDLTELMARERGLTVDVAAFNKLMDKQRERARRAQKKTVIELSQIETQTPTKFVGFDALETSAKVLEVVELKDKTAVILDTSACYAEMGGQVGDTGELSGSGQLWRIIATQKSGNTWLHIIEGEHTRPRVSQSAPSPIVSAQTDNSPTTQQPEPIAGARSDAREGACAPRELDSLPVPGNMVTLSVDRPRRHAIQRHHTVTHLLHWALHEVVSKEASQKGSFVGPDKLTFDFNCAPLTPQQVADVEKLVNERILENAGVSWTEIPYADAKGRPDIMQFFGDKYGDQVRVVQIGGHAQKLDGYSMELCGGTHTRATGEIGLFRIVGESAIAAGVRRIEAVAGLEAYQVAHHELELIKSIAGKVNTPVGELEKKIESLLAHQKELEKALKAAKQREAAQSAKSLVAAAETVNGVQLITKNLGEADGDTLQTIADALKGDFKGVTVLGGVNNGAVSLVAAVHPELTKKVQAGKLIQAIAPIVGGKGGGRPDNARGGGKEAGNLDEALAKVRALL